MTCSKFAIALGGAVLAGSLFVASAGSYAEKFAKIDADGDGGVSEAEFVAYATSEHDHSEADAVSKFHAIAGDDAILTLAEFEAAHAKKEDGHAAEAGS